MPSRTRAPARAARIALGIAISALLLYLTFRSLPAAQLASELKGMSLPWLAAAVVLTLGAFAGKIVRWRAMLAALGSDVGFKDAAVPFMSCVALNNLLPLRAGDVARVVAFKRFTGLQTSAQFGVLLLERLLDLAVLLLFLGLFMALRGAQYLPAGMAVGIAAVAAATVAAFLVLCILPRQVGSLLDRAAQALPVLRPVQSLFSTVASDIAVLTQGGRAYGLIGLSVGAWGLEAAVFLAVATGLGMSLGWEGALLGLSIGTLATLIPSAPGYAGTFHFAVAATAALLGAGGVAGAAYALIVHAAMWVTTTSTGLACLAVAGSRQVLDSAPADPHNDGATRAGPPPALPRDT